MPSSSSSVRTNFLKPALLLFIACLFAPRFALAADAATHPLDPLSKEEITATVEILRANGKVNPDSRFATVVLREPPKSEVLAYKPDSPFRREAFAIIYERATNKTFEAIVDLNKKSLASWKEVMNVQPPFLIEDFLLTQQIVQNDSEWQAAMRKRGITNFKNVQVDGMGSRFFRHGGRARRARSPRCFLLNEGTKNAYARPIEGVVAYVNLNTKKVYKLVDTGAVAVPKEKGELDMKSIGKLREAPKPLQIVQPQGASFEVNGNEVRWQNWRFRFACTRAKGLCFTQ